MKKQWKNVFAFALALIMAFASFPAMAVSAEEPAPLAYFSIDDLETVTDNARNERLYAGVASSLLENSALEPKNGHEIGSRMWGPAPGITGLQILDAWIWNGRVEIVVWMRGSGNLRTTSGLGQARIVDSRLVVGGGAQPQQTQFLIDLGVARVGSHWVEILAMAHNIDPSRPLNAMPNQMTIRDTLTIR